MQFIDLEKEGINKFEELKDTIDGKMDLSPVQANFIVYLLKKYNSKKILELGVSAGGSSLLILDTIKDFENAHLYSIDYLNYWYKDKNKPVGFVVNEKAPNLLDNWTLYSGNFACEFIDQICPDKAQDIDFCFIDTIHLRPGEILDFLMVLPYLKKNAVVVFHDISLHTFGEEFATSDANCILYSAIKGEKILPLNDCSRFPNMGAIILDDDIRERIFDVFNALLLRWYYILEKEEYLLILKHFEKHYEEELIDIYKKAYEYNNMLVTSLLQNNKLTNKDISKMFLFMLLSKVCIGKKKKHYIEKLNSYKQKRWIKTLDLMSKELII